ncbi:MAG: hypothetical protein HKN74_13985, partial [Acidimicrobiia bacterium]|nr:hypothetical protein [Acidimicrobiia bacterium]NNL68694.1 hypothetical protein [Acidimicrobiia bacterium]
MTDESPPTYPRAVGTELTGIGARREFRIGPMRIAGRRRRPSGEKPPLPREISAGGWIWI